MQSAIMQMCIVLSKWVYFEILRVLQEQRARPSQHNAIKEVFYPLIIKYQGAFKYEILLSILIKEKKKKSDSL